MPRRHVLTPLAIPSLDTLLGPSPCRLHPPALSCFPAPQDPGKVFKGKKMPGRMGGERKTVQNCQVRRPGRQPGAGCSRRRALLVLLQPAAARARAGGACAAPAPQARAPLPLPWRRCPHCLRCPPPSPPLVLPRRCSGWTPPATCCTCGARCRATRATGCWSRTGARRGAAGGSVEVQIEWQNGQHSAFVGGADAARAQLASLVAQLPRLPALLLARHTHSSPAAPACPGPQREEVGGAAAAAAGAHAAGGGERGHGGAQV